MNENDLQDFQDLDYRQSLTISFSGQKLLISSYYSLTCHAEFNLGNNTFFSFLETEMPQFLWKTDLLNRSCISDAKTADLPEMQGVRAQCV